MSELNPYESASDAPSAEEEVASGKAVYNVVSDTVVGINYRGKDNWFQAMFILVAVLIGAGIGAAVALMYDTLPWYGGAGIGAFGGLVVGFFLSGIILMIYRGVRHMKGKHD